LIPLTPDEDRLIEELAPANEKRSTHLEPDVASVAVGLEVSGAFLVGWSEFFDQAIFIRGEGDQ